MSMHRTPSRGPIDLTLVLDPVDTQGGELSPQAVQVQAELATGQRLAGLLLLGPSGPRRGQRLAHLAPRHAHHAVVVGDDRVAGPDDLAAHGEWHVDRTGRLLDRALRADRRRPGRGAPG